MQRDLSIDCSYIYHWFAKSARVSIKPSPRVSDSETIRRLRIVGPSDRFGGHPRVSQTKLRTVLVGIHELTKKEQPVHQNNVLEGVIH